VLTKRAPLRRSGRRSPSLELKCWQAIFSYGTDPIGELNKLGFANVPEAMEAARDAWRRLGILFMRDWKPEANRGRPWALEQFGHPGKL
jgi:hypothetical protein